MHAACYSRKFAPACSSCTFYILPMLNDDIMPFNIGVVLLGVVQSSRNSLERWTKQVLHVWATSRHTARELLAAYDKVADDIKSNTVVFITTARNAREIFANR